MPEVTKLKPGHEAHEILAEILESWHPELIEAGVTIGLEMAFPGEDGDPEVSAVKLHGYECAAVVRITPYRWRVRGIEDAIITIDSGHWERMTPDEKAALIDHEASHCLVCRDKDGAIKSDAHGRPKLKMRLHDVQIGWFMDVAARHGEASAEVQQAREIQEQHGQLLFSWAEGPPPVAKMARPA